MSTKDAILDEICIIERQYDVQVLYACESGSRAWGFASEGSDFDVRFVYKRPIGEYLRLQKPKDVIECTTDAENFAMGVDFDAVGWDLGKFLTLMRGSNPSTIEWMHSPIVYHEDSRFWKAKKLSRERFDPVSSAWHYYGMAKKHDVRYLKDEKVLAKKYLYILRGILSAKWSIKRFSPAPIAFDELEKAILVAELRPKVDELVKIKREGPEKALVEHDSALDNYIYANLNDLPAEIGKYRHHEPVEWAKVEQVYRNLLGLDL